MYITFFFLGAWWRSSALLPTRPCLTSWAAICGKIWVLITDAVKFQGLHKASGWCGSSNITHSISPCQSEVHMHNITILRHCLYTLCVCYGFGCKSLRLCVRIMCSSRVCSFALGVWTFQQSLHRIIPAFQLECTYVNRELQLDLNQDTTCDRALSSVCM